MAILAAVPATAQQVPVQLQTIELCSGCFAYLEFPPLVESDTTFSLARWHEAEGRSQRPRWFLLSGSEQSTYRNKDWIHDHAR